MAAVSARSLFGGSRDNGLAASKREKPLKTGLDERNDAAPRCREPSRWRCASRSASGSPLPRQEACSTLAMNELAMPPHHIVSLSPFPDPSSFLDSGLQPCLFCPAPSFACRISGREQKPGSWQRKRARTSRRWLALRTVTYGKLIYRLQDRYQAVESIRQCLLDVVCLVNAAADHYTPDRETPEIPPSYSESIADLPPDYAETVPRPNAVAQIQRKSTVLVTLPDFDMPGRGKGLLPPIGPMSSGEVDWKDTSTFKQTAGKKKAQKKADQAKWADGSGDEGAKDGGGDGGEGGGEGGGDAGGGAGGDEGGGGGGDDWAEWDTGKKKKGKKAKEDEKKKKEEEEAAAAKKEEEPKNPLSWADEDPGDDWGAYTTTTAKKDKKDKKKKVCFSFRDMN